MSVDVIFGFQNKLWPSNFQLNQISQQTRTRYLQLWSRQGPLLILNFLILKWKAIKHISSLMDLVIMALIFSVVDEIFAYTAFWIVFNTIVLWVKSSNIIKALRHHFIFSTNEISRVIYLNKEYNFVCKIYSICYLSCYYAPIF